MGKFTAQVDAWAKGSVKRMTAIQRESTQRTIDDAQTPTAKGGRMRVDTGFLRASGQLSLNGMPTGPVRGNPTGTYTEGQFGKPTELVLARSTLEDTLFFGWTANYARAREAKDGFLRIAAQKWPQTVAQVTKEAKARIRTK